MKKLIYLPLLTLLFFACAKQEESNLNEESFINILVDSIKTYSNITETQKVKVEGTIVHTCKHGGKRAFIIGENPDLKLRLETSDKVTNFTKEMEGSKVTAIGYFKALVIDKEYLDKWEKELLSDLTPEAESHSSCLGDDNVDNKLSHKDQELQKIKLYRENLEKSQKDKLEYFWIDLVEYKI